MTARLTTATTWRCAECGAAHGPDRRCDGSLNGEWHVIASNRAIVRANVKREGKKQS